MRAGEKLCSGVPFSDTTNVGTFVFLLKRSFIFTRLCFERDAVVEGPGLLTGDGVSPEVLPGLLVQRFTSVQKVGKQHMLALPLQLTGGETRTVTYSAVSTTVVVPDNGTNLKYQKKHFEL